jgi:microcystin degradation protein MlrC
MAGCREAERGPVLAAGLLLVQPWIDVEGLGCRAVATADGDQGLAQRVADDLADALWDERRAFLAGRRPPVGEALAEALAGPAPYVFADSGDATTGGSIGDSTELVRAALRDGGSASIALSVLAPDAAAEAHRAGVGATIAAALGSGEVGAYNERVLVDAQVERLFDGELAYTHPVFEGYHAESGPAALLRRAGLHVVVHARTVGVIDPAVYVALGLDPARFDVLQAKSHVSYKAGFEHVTPRSVVADTDGPTTGNLIRLPFCKRPRPLFPFELA